TDTLFDALWIPREIVIHHQITELQIDTFGGRLRGNHDGGFIAEILHERCALVSRRRIGDVIGASMALEPRLVNLPGFLVGVRTIEEDYLAGEFSFFEDLVKVFLRPPRFRKDKGLLLERRNTFVLPRLFSGGEAPAQGGQ